MPRTPEQKAAENEYRRTRRKTNPAVRERERKIANTYRANHREHYRKLNREHQARFSKDGRGKIYFIQALSGPVKIGFTTKTVVGRLQELQVANHEELTVLGWTLAERTDETKLQDRFADLLIRGEWYRPDERLLVFIRELPINT